MIQVDPLAVGLGVVTVGESAAQPVTVGNGGSDLELTAISLCQSTSAWSAVVP